MKIKHNKYSNRAYLSQIIKHKRFTEVYPYTYLIVRTTDGKMYHGSRYQNVKFNRSPIDDLGIHYFSHSRYLNASKHNIDDYVFILKHTFNTVEDMIEYEGRVNERVIYHPMFLNRNARGAILFTPEVIEKLKKFLIGIHKGRIPWNLGKPGNFLGRKHSPETIAKMVLERNSHEGKLRIAAATVKRLERQKLAKLNNNSVL